MDYSKMTLKEKVLMTFVVTIREINKHGGPEKFFEKYPVGGMYFDETKNIDILSGKMPELGTGMRRETLHRCIAASKRKMLVCADAGTVYGQKQAHFMCSARYSGREDTSYTLGKLLGMQMNDNDVDWILGPAVDMNFMRQIPDVKKLAKCNRAIVRGIQDQGVCATAKHFPGLLTNPVNMHYAPGKNTMDFEKWWDTYGYLYKELFDGNVMCVMTTHVTLRSFSEKSDNGYYPIATFSHDLTTKLLKEKLGFKGAVVTDALIMGGMATGDIVAETVQAFAAGADLLLWPPIEAADAICEKLENGEIPMSRLDDALERIEKMRTFREKALAEKSFEKPSAERADEFARATIKESTMILKDESNMLPISTDKYKKILILEACDDAGRDSCRLIKERLENEGFSADIEHYIYDEPSRVCWQDDIDELQAKYDLVIVNLSAEDAFWTEPYMLVWASHLFKKEKKIIINWGSDYLADDYFPEEKTIIQCGNPICEYSADCVAELLVKQI